MTQEEFQELMLHELKGIKGAVDILTQKIATVDQRLTQAENKADDIEHRLVRIENNQQEQGDMLQALLYNHEFTHVEANDLKTTTASVESMKYLDARFAALNMRLFELETALQALTAAK